MFYSFTVQWWCDGKEITNNGYVCGNDYTNAVDKLTHYFGDEEVISIQIAVIEDTDIGVMVTKEIVK